MSREVATLAPVAEAPPRPPDLPDPDPSPDPGPDRPTSTGWAVARLALAIATVVALFLVFHLGALLVVIVAIVVMVMVHELGHFATAKWSGMKVTQYFLGFGPRLWSIRRGETEYGVKAIPAGGYVTIPGMSHMEEIDPADEARTYRQAPFHKRIIVASAGSVMHFVMAFLLAYGSLLYFGTPHYVQIPISGFASWPGHAQTAAQQAGLKKGDVVVAVNGHRLTDPDQFTSAVGASAGKPVVVTVERGGRALDVTVTPAVGHRIDNGTKEVLGPAAGSGSSSAAGAPITGSAGASTGLIGVTLEGARPAFTPEGPVRSIGTAGATVGNDAWGTIKAIPQGIGSLIDDVTNPHQAAQSSQTGDRAVSLIGASRLATQAEQQGSVYLINVLILLNVVFGLLNMLPMLPLDGGHVAIALYERIRTRRGRPYYRADVAKLMPVAYAFMAVLLVVSVSAIYLDIAHPIANPFH